MMTDAKIRVLLVDDHEVVRQGFKYFIEVTEDVTLVGEASNGVEAINATQLLQPDVILMDLMMPKMGGIEAIGNIKQTHPHIKIIALTSYNDDDQLVKDALQAGANGYFFKDISVDDLAKAIRKVIDGELVLSSDATKMLIQSSTEKPKPDIHLTNREQEVLQLIVAGKSNRAIADELVISRATAKFHVSSIISKFGASSRTEVAALAVQYDLIDREN